MALRAIDIHDILGCTLSQARSNAVLLAVAVGVYYLKLFVAAVLTRTVY